MLEILEERKKKKKSGEKKGMWDRFRERRKAGKRRLRPGEKGYPKTLDIEGVEHSLREFIVETLLQMGR